MHYQVLFRLEKRELIDKLHKKIKNLRNYMETQGHNLEVEVVIASDAIEHFKGDYSDFIDATLDIALCANALQSAQMEPIYDRNIRTVPAAIGEIVEKKAVGWIEFTIE